MTAPLDELERRVALSGAGLAAVASVVLWAPGFEHAAAVAWAGVGVVLAAFLGAAAFARLRLPTGMGAVLLAFGPWGPNWVIGFPYLCLAAWLLFRHGRATAARAQRAAGRADQPEQADRQRRSGRDRSAAARPGRARPEANKRYTPPQRRR